MAGRDVIKLKVKKSDPPQFYFFKNQKSSFFYIKPIHLFYIILDIMTNALLFKKGMLNNKQREESTVPHTLCQFINVYNPNMGKLFTVL